MIVALAATVAFIMGWLFFSRAPWPERIGAVVVAIVAAFVTKLFLHESMTR